jgi:glutaredoxin
MMAALVILATPGTAGAQPSEPVTVELFGRADCPHCERAQVWAAELDRRRPDVEIVYRDVGADRAALERLTRLAGEAGVELLAVPALYARGRLFVGFDAPGTTGRDLEVWLDQGAEEARRVHLPIFGEVVPESLGLPLFTIVLGLIDGFNPCAMWVLLFLLSLLVNLHSRARMAAIGGTFVVVSGVAYYVFMAAWLNVFLWAGYSRGLQIGLGLVALGIGSVHVKDFFALHRGFSLSIPESAKPGLYARVRRIIHAENLAGAMGMVIALAVVVNLIELLCTAGLPAIYTQVLASQGLPVWQYYLYLALYIVAYMIDDALMLVIAVITLSRRKLQERTGRWLKLVSGVVMAILGLLLIAAPGALSW